MKRPCHSIRRQPNGRLSSEFEALGVTVPGMMPVAGSGDDRVWGVGEAGTGATVDIRAAGGVQLFIVNRKRHMPQNNTTRMVTPSLVNEISYAEVRYECYDANTIANAVRFAMRII
jgi:hypothetical protein